MRERDYQFDCGFSPRWRLATRPAKHAWPSSRRAARRALCAPSVQRSTPNNPARSSIHPAASCQARRGYFWTGSLTAILSEIEGLAGNRKHDAPRRTIIRVDVQANLTLPGVGGALATVTQPTLLLAVQDSPHR